MRLGWLTAFAAGFLGTLLSAAKGSAIAFDSAGDSAYHGGVYAFQNGGYGWGGAWSGDGNSLGSSSTNGNGDPGGTGDVNSPRTPLGRAWGLVQPIGPEPFKANRVSRPFAGALVAGDTFAIDFDNGTFSASGTYAAVGFGPSSAPFFDYLWSGRIGVICGPRVGGKDYFVWQPGTSALTDSGVPVTDQGVHIELTVLDDADARVSITSLATGQTGAIPVAYVPVSGVELVNDAYADFFRPAYTVYFNNMAITPEPGCGLIMAFCPLLFLLRRRALRERAGSPPSYGGAAITNSDKGLGSVLSERVDTSFF